MSPPWLIPSPLSGWVLLSSINWAGLWGERILEIVMSCYPKRQWQSGRPGEQTLWTASAACLLPVPRVWTVHTACAWARGASAEDPVLVRRLTACPPGLWHSVCHHSIQGATPTRPVCVVRQPALSMGFSRQEYWSGCLSHQGGPQREKAKPNCHIRCRKRTHIQQQE